MDYMHNALTLNDWSKLSGLNLAIHKCSIMSSKGNEISSYSINGVQLGYSNTYTDLDVIINHNLSFNDHIDNIIRKAYRMINIIFRVFRCNKHLPLPWSLPMSAPGKYRVLFILKLVANLFCVKI